MKSKEELNTLFLEKCKKYLYHQIKGKESNISAMLAEGKKYLYQLPKYPFDTCKRSSGSVDRSFSSIPTIIILFQHNTAAEKFL